MKIEKNNYQKKKFYNGWEGIIKNWGRWKASTYEKIYKVIFGNQNGFQ